MRSSAAAKQVPLEFMVDISPDHHSSDMGSRGRRSVWRARELFDRELLRGKHPSLRHGEQPANGTAKALPYSAFEPLDHEAPPADALFFVVEERSVHPSGAVGGTEPGGAETSRAREGVGVRRSFSVDSRPTGAPASHQWMGARVTGEVGQIRGEEASFSAATSAASKAHAEDASGTDPRGAGSPRFSRDNRGGDSDSHDRGEGDYTVPYWAILRVGESESDPGDDSRSWPLVASGLSSANGGADGIDGHSSHGAGQAPVRIGSRLKSPPLPPRVHRPTYSPDSVGYRIAVIDVKVSIYHPKGSAVAANKDAIMAGLTRVRSPS